MKFNWEINESWRITRRNQPVVKSHYINTIVGNGHYYPSSSPESLEPFHPCSMLLGNWSSADLSSGSTMQAQTREEWMVQRVFAWPGLLLLPLPWKWLCSSTATGPLVPSLAWLQACLGCGSSGPSLISSMQWVLRSALVAAVWCFTIPPWLSGNYPVFVCPVDTEG